MQILDVSMNVGPGVSPAQLEGLVKAVRVATDVGRAAEFARIRRSASERFKFPTDLELSEALERLPPGSEISPRYRLRQFLEARRSFRRRARQIPPELWWDYLERGREQEQDPLYSKLARSSGYGRAFEASPLPWLGGGAVGLDAMDPELYSALVADEVARLAPPEVIVRAVRYQNPFGEELAAIDQGAAALTKVAGVIETSATLGSRRMVARADAAVAKATVDDRVESSRLDVDLKREELRASRLANDLAEQELLAKRILNAHALAALSITRRQQAVAEHLRTAGQLDEADAVTDEDPADAAALLEFAVHPVHLTRTYDPEPPGEEGPT